jgi:hypothetical protein
VLNVQHNCYLHNCTIEDEVSTDPRFRLRHNNNMPNAEHDADTLQDDEAGKGFSGWRLEHEAKDIRQCDFILNTCTFRNADIVSDILAPLIEPLDVDIDIAIDRGLKVWANEPPPEAKEQRRKGRPRKVVRDQEIPGAGLEQRETAPAEEEEGFVSTSEGSDGDTDAED